MKIGLVGYSCCTGLGEVNRQIATYCNIHSWLIYPHRSRQTHLYHDISCMKAVVADHHDTQEEVRQFVKDVDVIVFVETPYYNSLLQMAKQYGKRVVCIPMQEWMPVDNQLQTAWTKYVDLFICPIRYTYELFKDKLPCINFSWPYEVNRFKFKHRSRCNRFLFINGGGGHRGRKGADVIEKALQIDPKLPITIYSQDPRMVSRLGSLDSLPNVIYKGEAATNEEMYEDGDVLLCPHHIDGLCLEPREAAAVGMPTLVTAGGPWEDLDCVSETIPATVHPHMFKRPVKWYEPNPQELVKLCNRLIDAPIGDKSSICRISAENRCWDWMAQEFVSLVTQGVAS